MSQKNLTGAHEWVLTARTHAAWLLAAAHKQADIAELLATVFADDAAANHADVPGLPDLIAACPNVGVGPGYGLCSQSWHRLVLDLLGNITSNVCWSVADLDGTDPVRGSLWRPAPDTPYRERQRLVGHPMPPTIAADAVRYVPAAADAIRRIPYADVDWERVRYKLMAEFAAVRRTPANTDDDSAYVPAMELANRHGFSSYKIFKKFLDEYGVDSKQDPRHKQRRLVHAADCLRALAERDSKAEVALEVAAAMHEQIEGRKAAARRNREQK